LNFREEDYGTELSYEQESEFEEEVLTGRGQSLSDVKIRSCHPSSTQTDKEFREDTQKDESDEGDTDENEDADRCEEWERHEALHEDVTSQERLKERLYEEEIELTWEKGG